MQKPRRALLGRMLGHRDLRGLDPLQQALTLLSGPLTLNGGRGAFLPALPQERKHNQRQGSHSNNHR